MSKEFKTNFGKIIFTGAAIIAMATPGSVFAETAGRTANQNSVPRYDGPEVKKSMEEAKEAVSDKVEDVSEATKETYEDIKNAVEGDTNVDIVPVDADQHMTAAEMIGQPVKDYKGNPVAKVKDIIVDHNGDATMLVLSEHSLPGFGKLVAFDYRSIAQENDNRFSVAPLTEAMIDQAESFSYERSDESKTVRVIPQDGYSVAELLKSKLTDSDGKVVADVNDISFRHGEADQLVVGFDQVLGMGGKQAALDFNDPAIVKDKGDPQFRLSAEQTRQFEQYKKTALD